MFNTADFRDVVSGRRRGPAAGLLRGVLRVAELPYSWVVNRRNRDFESGRRPRHDVPIPVISVGNITLGGTGKTPLVEWLARWFMSRQIRVALVSRGYKSAAGSLNDEGQELAQKLPGVPHVQNRDRVAAARQAIEQYASQVIILDDGFQHRRIHRNLDIVLLDALEPFGFEHVFPRGTLREPLTGLSRADLVVLTRADMVTEQERSRIRSVVKKYVPQAAWAECRHAACSLLTADGHEESLDTLRGQRVAAFCGLGNPSGFRHTLKQCGCNVVAWREFPDHFAYNQSAINDLASWASSHDAQAAVCTHKDLVKLGVLELAGRPLRAVRVGLEFLTGQDVLQSRLEKILSELKPTNA